MRQKERRQFGAQVLNVERGKTTSGQRQNTGEAFPFDDYRCQNARAIAPLRNDSTMSQHPSAAAIGRENGSHASPRVKKPLV